MRNLGRIAVRAGRETQNAMAAEELRAVTRTWIVTGAASGLGHEIARAALETGDAVALTDRSVEGAAGLVDEFPGKAATIALDVTDPVRVAEVVAEVVERFGTVDVLVNAAGRGHYGAVEETTEAELRSLMELSFFGPAALTRAVLPHMRAQGSGAIVQISSLAGQSSSPGLSAYSAGKFALEGFSEALAQEVSEHGIKVLVVQPGSMRTNFGGAAVSESTPIAAYDDTVRVSRANLAAIAGKQVGDPAKVAVAILSALANHSTPLRLAFGDDAWEILNETAAKQHDERVVWERVTRSIGFDE